MIVKGIGFTESESTLLIEESNISRFQKRDEPRKGLKNYDIKNEQDEAIGSSSMYE